MKTALATLVLTGLLGLGGATASTAEAHEGGCDHPGSCQVKVLPGHYETRAVQVQEPGQWVYEAQSYTVPGRYETRWQQVWNGCGYTYRTVSVWVPPCTQTRQVRVFKPGCTVTKHVRVFVPGRTVAVCATGGGYGHGYGHGSVGYGR